MLASAEYRRGYDAGYKQALRDALKERDKDAAFVRHMRILHTPLR